MANKGRRSVKIKMPKKSSAKEKLIGEVTHYFGNIGVAVIKLSGPLKKGDTIRIEGGETDFKQKVSSMEADYKKKEKAKKGDEVGLKVNKKVREGYKAYKVE